MFPASVLYKKKGLEPTNTVGLTMLFKINSDIARHLVHPCAGVCPNALGRIVNPVNNVFPAMELYKNLGHKFGGARNLVYPWAELCPNAALGRTINPVNSEFPAMELCKEEGLDPMNIVGIINPIPAGMPRSPGNTRYELFMYGRCPRAGLPSRTPRPFRAFCFFLRGLQANA